MCNAEERAPRSSPQPGAKSVPAAASPVGGQGWLCPALPNSARAGSASLCPHKHCATPVPSCSARRCCRHMAGTGGEAIVAQIPPSRSSGLAAPRPAPPRASRPGRQPQPVPAQGTPGHGPTWPQHPPAASSAQTPPSPPLSPLRGLALGRPPQVIPLLPCLSDTRTPSPTPQGQGPSAAGEPGSPNAKPPVPR